MVVLKQQRHGGLTFAGGLGFGLRAGISGGVAGSNASQPQDLGGPFAVCGGGLGPVSAEGQAGSGTHGQFIGAGYIGGGVSTPEGYCGATATGVWQWW
jgi:hypothetical protein